MNCPYCDRPCQVVLMRAAQRTNDVPNIKTFGMSPSWAVGDDHTLSPIPDWNEQPAEHSIQAPARAPTVQSDVVVPMLWSIITSFLLTNLITGAWILLGEIKLDNWWFPGGLFIKPALIWIITFSVVLLVCWYYGLKLVYDLMYKIETIIGRDIDKDGQVGQPQPRESGTIVIQPHGGSGSQAKKWQDLTADEKLADLYEFTRLVWKRQQIPARTGATAMRGTDLPSGFKLNDTIHGKLLEMLDGAGVIRRAGKAWTLEEPPHKVRELFKVW